MPSSGWASKLAVEFVDGDKNLRSFAPLGGWGHLPPTCAGVLPVLARDCRVVWRDGHRLGACLLF
jgi:hypothetical protein